MCLCLILYTNNAVDCEFDLTVSFHLVGSSIYFAINEWQIIQILQGSPPRFTIYRQDHEYKYKRQLQYFLYLSTCVWETFEEQHNYLKPKCI